MTRKIRNAKVLKKRWSQITDMSSDKNSIKADSSHSLNESVMVKDTVVSEKHKAIPNDDTVNADEQTVHLNEETVNPDEETVNPDAESVNPNEETVNPNAEGVNPSKQTVNPNAESEIVSVKTKKYDEEDVKPNVQQVLFNGDSAICDKSHELFSELPIKKEESEEDAGHDDSSISVKGKLSDELTGRSFVELVTAAENGKQEDVGVDVSLYTDSAQMLQADDKNTQYLGNSFLILRNEQFVGSSRMRCM